MFRPILHTSSHIPYLRDHADDDPNDHGAIGNAMDLFHRHEEGADNEVIDIGAAIGRLRPDAFRREIPRERKMF